MVFMFHATDELLFTSSHVRHDFESIFGEGGSAGVGFFFVLSGFVLTWSARPGDTARAFWRRRFWKIYPNHVVTLAVAVVLLGVVSDEAVDPGHAVLNLSLLQGWYPRLQLNVSFNAVSWSLSCEAFFYLSFPLLYLLIRRIRPDRLWLWAGVVVAVMFVVPVIGIALPRQPFLAFANASQAQLWFTYFFPPVRLLDFVFGILLARIVDSGGRVPLGLGGSTALCVAAYALAPLFPLTYPLAAVTVVPLGLLIAAGAVADVEGRPTILSGRVALRLGEISFAFYMCHWLVLVYGHKALGTTWSTPAALGVLAMLLGATLLMAWGLYRLVERPLMRRFSRAPLPTVPGLAGTVGDDDDAGLDEVADTIDDDGVTV
jgi:mycarose O-acyltransferase